MKINGEIIHYNKMKKMVVYYNWNGVSFEPMKDYRWLGTKKEEDSTFNRNLIDAILENLHRKMIK